MKVIYFAHNLTNARPKSFFFREKQIMWILFSLCQVATYGEKIEPKQVNIDKNSFGLSS